jgi:hypothetical protein
MSSRFAAQKNSAFFQNKEGGMGEIMIKGANPDEVKSFDNGGKISEKGMMNMFKRAKDSGAFIVQNGGLTEFPMELCDFVNFKVPD